MDWKRVLRTWLIGLVVIAGLMVLSYYGFRLWIQYANSDLFKGEVNAAIITGVVGILTLLGTTVVQAYFQSRSERITVRDEIFRRRLEAYHELRKRSLDLVEKLALIPYHSDPQFAAQVRKMIDEYFTFHQAHRWILTPSVFKMALELYRAISWCIMLYEPYVENKEIRLVYFQIYFQGYGTKGFDRTVQYHFNYYTNSDDKKILLAKNVFEAIGQEYASPLFKQMEKELRLRKIHKELEDLRY